MTVAALYVIPNGPYANIPGIDLWPESRDARKYNGPWPVVAHSPCQRWGRYWFGGPSARVRQKLGDDGGCFKSALQAVRKWGGVLEHPEASHAFKKFYLPIPNFHGGWTRKDWFGGKSCCVSQGNYGHRARKMTWLYAVSRGKLPELKWGIPLTAKVQPDLGYHSAEERRRAVKTGVCQRLSHRQRLLTPELFRDLLIGIAAESQSTSVQKENTEMKLDLGIMAGAESKAWLAGLTQQLDRLEKLTGGKGIDGLKSLTTVAATEPVAPESEESEDEDEDFTAKKKPAKKASASFDEDESDGDDEDESVDEDDEEEKAPPAKTKKAGRPPKYTVDDVNDACKARALAAGGKKGRAEVIAILQKKFGTATVSELKPEHYAACIAAMAV